MRYVCDAPGDKTWFRLMTEAEAIIESEQMGHAVEKHFRREAEKAAASYKPTSPHFIEQDIGKQDHMDRTMPQFLTLRDMDGTALATAMLPPSSAPEPNFRIIIVGPKNADPYPNNDAAIAALGRHFKLALDRERCFPYRR